MNAPYLVMVPRLREFVGVVLGGTAKTGTGFVCLRELRGAQNFPEARFCLWHTGKVQFLDSMRKAATLLLLAVFACLAGAPIASAFGGADQQLPACCRAAGAHHCAMKDAPQSGRSLTGSHCRAFPMHAAALLQTCAAPPVGRGLAVAFTTDSFVTVSALECFAQARRTRSPRGPPLPLPALS
jgi:hypothetical protein